METKLQTTIVRCWLFVGENEEPPQFLIWWVRAETAIGYWWVSEMTKTDCSSYHD